MWIVFREWEGVGQRNRIIFILDNFGCLTEGSVVEEDGPELLFNDPSVETTLSSSSLTNNWDFDLGFDITNDISSLSSDGGNSVDSLSREGILESSRMTVEAEVGRQEGVALASEELLLYKQTMQKIRSCVSAKNVNAHKLKVSYSNTYRKNRTLRGSH